MPSPKTRAAAAKPQPAADPAVPREASLDDLDDRSRALLTAYMLDYEVKKGQIDDLEADLEAIKLDKIEPLRLRLGLTKIDSERWYIARRPGRSSLDRDKAKLYLVNKGVSVKLVTDAFDLATSTGKPFTEIKRKKGM